MVSEFYPREGKIESVTVLILVLMEHGLGEVYIITVIKPLMS